MLPRPLRRIFASSLALIATGTVLAGSAVWAGQPLTALIEALRSSGLDVAYSSELVPAGARIVVEPAGRNLKEQTESALSAWHLRLHAVTPSRYVIDRQVSFAAIPAGPPTAKLAGGTDSSLTPLDEVLVYASRGATVFDDGALSGRQSLRPPGSATDGLESLRTLPGIAADTSARPYVRGSAQEDVLVIFDHVPIPDPFHAITFQNFSSVFDASVLDRVDLYSGGFPVRFGTRSGGVVDLQPHRTAAGHELTIGAGLSALRVTSAGHAANAPVEWLAAVRRSVVNPLIDAADRRANRPVSFDALARVQWQPGERQSWTFGGVLLDDQSRLQSRSIQEAATFRYRDQNLWLTGEFKPTEDWQGRTTLVAEQAHRGRSGQVLRPGLMSGSLDDQRDMRTFALYNEWKYVAPGQTHWDLGAEFANGNGDATYLRDVQYDTAAAESLGIVPQTPADFALRLRSQTFGAFASFSQLLGRRFEYELGVRADGQQYGSLSYATEWSPRVNLRYRVTDSSNIYASVGKYAQAQRPDEQRLEESQFTPDRPQVNWQETLGVDYRQKGGTLWRLEIYHKHWDRVSPYFENLLISSVLLPELAPFRVRVAPRTAVAQGAEFSVRSPPDRLLQYWASYTYANVADRIERQNVVRSWDQRSALSAGADLSRRHFSGTAALRWHSGWPTTLVTTSVDPNTSAAQMQVGLRNAVRLRDYMSLDLRAAWTRPLPDSEMEFWAELSNSLNRANDCCAGGETVAPGFGVNGNQAPRLLNLGLLWRFH